jgi:branched-subunit amino acid transport protein
MIDRQQFWIVVVVLGLATYGIRFSFLGLLGNRPLPKWMQRCLRYTAVSVLPALVAPAVLWPAASHGQTDPVRLAAATATVAIGVLSRNFMAAIAAGVAVLLALPHIF